MTDLPSPLTATNFIHDPVHGRVWLTKVEIELINTPEFQRLRGIRQLTPVDLVFPGATHNRFAHSIGAAHIIGIITRQKRVADYFSGDLEHLVQPLRLAALLHDIGHLPFSHVGEMAWLAAEPDGAFAYHDHPDGPLTVYDVAASARAHTPLHEQLSALLIAGSRLGEIIDRELEPIDGRPASEVVQMIVAGTHPDLVARNLLSSDLDCDRLDYLLRDSLTAGLVYGHIDLTYLAGALAIGHDSDGPALAIDGRHGLLTGEHFLLARYFHYAQFVTHKTVAAAEVTLVAALLEMIRLGWLSQASSLTGDDVEPGQRIAELMKLTDAHIEAKLGRASRGEGSPELIEAAQRLLERKLPKVAARSEGLEPARKAGQPHAHNWDRLLSTSSGKQKLADEHEIDPRSFCYRKTTMPLTGVEGDISPADAIQDHENIKSRVRKAAKVIFDDGPPALLIEHSPLLKGLSTHRWTTRRIFSLEPLDSYHPRTPTENHKALRACCEQHAN
jgi:uncharacterized protein